MVERFTMALEHDWVCARDDQHGAWVRYTDYEVLRDELEAEVNHNAAVSERETNRADKAVSERDELARVRDELLAAINDVRGHFKVEYSDGGFAPSISYDSKALPKIIAILDRLADSTKGAGDGTDI